MKGIENDKEPPYKKVIDTSSQDSDGNTNSEGFFTSEEEEEETGSDVETGDNATAYNQDESVLDRNSLDIVPISVQKRVEALANHIKEKGGGRITWDRNGTILVDGAQIKGSNITDILIDLASDRQAKKPLKGTPGPPIGLSRLSRVLKDTNVSRNLIRNQRRRGHVYGSPTLRGDNLPQSPRDIEISSFGTPPQKVENKSFLGGFFKNWNE